MTGRKNIRLGLDFDNTIICYDSVFHSVAVEKKLVPASLPSTKSHVRDYLRAKGKEDDWTRLQGYVYGKRLDDASLFAGVKDCLAWCREHGISFFIISHKTRHPYMGPKYDLHKAAGSWLSDHGFFDPDQIGMSRDRVFFELTKKEKIARINSLGCTHFVDDLPEILREPGLDSQVAGILFDPGKKHMNTDFFAHIASWHELKMLLAKDKANS